MHESFRGYCSGTFFQKIKHCVSPLFIHPNKERNLLCVFDFTEKMQKERISIACCGRHLKATEVKTSERAVKGTEIPFRYMLIVI